MARRADLPLVSRARLARVALAAQGLHRSGAFGRGARAALRAIEHLGYVQIDTISVVARAHHHTLFSRVPDYRPEMLEQLQAERRVFEYWSHAAAYLPMRDFRFALPRMQHVRDHGSPWLPTRDLAFERQLLERIASDGPLCTRDLDSKRDGASGWWNWSPAKKAIEALFFEGRLLCIGRDGFAKVYDLPERALPKDVDTTTPDTDAFADYLVQTHLRSHGFGTLPEFSYGRRGKPLRVAIGKRVDDGVAAGELLRARLDSDGSEVILRRDAMDARPRIANEVRLLSPFDNAVIQRDRSVRVHDFDYQIECYVPAAKRRFGYFCLPLQYGERLVGRADCKAERRAGVLKVHALHIERDDLELDEFTPALASALGRFAAFNGCREVVVSTVAPRSLAKSFRQALHRALSDTAIEATVTNDSTS